MNNRHVNLLFLIGAASLGYYVYRKIRGIKGKPPATWEKVGKVEKLFIYPLEGGCKQEVKHVYCTEFGPLQFGQNTSDLIDRSFVVYNEDTLNCEINLPKLDRIKVIMGYNQFQLDVADKPPLVITLASLKRQTLTVEYFKNSISVRDCGCEAARWLSEYLLGCNDGLRLAIHALATRTFRCEPPTESWLNPYCEWRHGFPRRQLRIPIVEGKSKETKRLLEINAAFSTYSLISTASVQIIKNTLEENITVDNFRPRILIQLDREVDTPFIEDTFKWIKIGNAVFTDVTSNTITHLILSDPNSTEKQEIDLKSLKLMENCGFSDVEYPAVGINMEIFQRAAIKVDDAVYVKYK